MPKHIHTYEHTYESYIRGDCGSDSWVQALFESSSFGTFKLYTPMKRFGQLGPTYVVAPRVCSAKVLILAPFLA